MATYTKKRTWQAPENKTLNELRERSRDEWRGEGGVVK
jgi:hypothetical protein